MLDEDFQTSYDRIFGLEIGIGAAGDRFFEVFYRHFLSNAEVAALFQETDMAAQVRMLKQSFFKLVGLSQGSEWTPELDRLAARHKTLAIPEHLFDAWLEAVLNSVAEMDSQANDHTLLAWRLALQPGLIRMRHWLPEPSGGSR